MKAAPPKKEKKKFFGIFTNQQITCFLTNQKNRKKYTYLISQYLKFDRLFKNQSGFKTKKDLGLIFLFIDCFSLIMLYVFKKEKFSRSYILFLFFIFFYYNDNSTLSVTVFNGI